MAVIQFSVPSEYYVRWVERAAALGLSEHQLAKYLAILSEDSVADEDILAHKQKVARQGANRKLRARTLFD